MVYRPDLNRYRANPDRYRVEPYATTPEPAPDPEAEAKAAAELVVQIERAACAAARIPHPLDYEAGGVSGLYHRLGTWRIIDCDPALDAAVAIYPALTIVVPFHAYRAYLDAVGRIRSLKKAEWTEISGIDNRFRHSFSVDRYTKDRIGYCHYIRDQSPDFFRIVSQRLPFYAPEEDRRTHTYVWGTTGSGKSELLKALIYSYASQKDSAGVIVMEPSGKLVSEIAHWPEFIDNNRLIYIKLDLEHGMVPTINPLEISGVDPLDCGRVAIGIKQVVAQQVFSALEQVLGERAGGHITINMRALLIPCLLTLLDKPGATLLDLQRFMDDENNADLIAFGASRTHYPSVCSFFQGAFSSDHFKGTKHSIHTKLQTLFDITFFSEIVCGRSTIDLKQAMDERKVVLFDLSKGKIGEEAISALGCLFVAMIQALAKRREDIPEQQRVPVHLIIDEFHNYVTPSIGEILTESRKLCLFLTMCSLSVGYKLGPELTRIATGMTNVKISGRVLPPERRRSAIQLGSEPEELAVLDRAKGSFYIAAGGTPPLRFRTGTELLGGRHSMTPELWRRTVKRQIRAYYRSAIQAETSTGEQGASGAPRRRTRRIV